HVGIGEHELIFHSSGSSASASSSMGGVSDLPTIAVPYNPAQELTYRTREDELMTAATGDDFSTRSMDNGTAAQPASASETPFEDVPSTPPPAGPAPTAPSTAPAPAAEAATVQAALPPNVPPAAKAPATSSPSGAQSAMN